MGAAGHIKWLGYAGRHLLSGRASGRPARPPPTVKPVGMIADAVKRIAPRGQIVLGCSLLCGSGAKRAGGRAAWGRQGRGLEIDPAQRLSDLAIRRWQVVRDRAATPFTCGSGGPRGRIASLVAVDAPSTTVDGPGKADPRAAAPPPDREG
jgi:hypothetical protein